MEKYFYKYHGAGNDFVIFDMRNHDFELTNYQVAAICHRRFGVGADGLMTLSNDPLGSDFFMRYWNSDGGESTMCGNGGRSIALFAHHLGIGGPTKCFNANDGGHSVEILNANHESGFVKLGMIDVDSIEELSANSFFTNTGSPHYVEIVKDISQVEIKKHGNVIRHDSRFAKIGGTNVNFVEITGTGTFRIRTFERGVEDETMACGTGATAAALVVNYAEQSNIQHFTIETMGGNLEVDFKKDHLKFREIKLSGPAAKVFEGKINI